jgi:hypothetical protein
MKEDFLHYLWQHQYFDPADLRTVEGEWLLVVRPGIHNTDAGPDFLGAQLQLNAVRWAGSVEIHLKASDWQRHQHQTDRKYDQVILHVVWENDRQVFRPDGTAIPTLELRPRVKSHLLTAYQNLLHTVAAIPCGTFIRQVPDLTRTMMLDRALLERLEEKAALVLEQFNRNGNDWEVTAYQVLMAAFGFKINQEPFRRLSRVLPLSLLKRHRIDLFQLEALLLGQAGLLPAEAVEDAYVQSLDREYAFLAHKYNLAADSLRASDWNYLRLRPANFPAVRLAQLAALLASREHLFASLLQGQNLRDYENFFRVVPSAYWQTHYRPGHASSRGAGAMGTASIHTLISNTVIPLLVAYSRQLNTFNWQEKAMNLLEQLPPEHNRITRIYEDLQVENKTAADSQAFLSLHRRYCQPRQCLRCAIGNHILKNNLSAT